MALPQKTSVISFNIEGIHPDIGTIIDNGNCGAHRHHCAQPIMTFFDILGQSGHRLLSITPRKKSI
jgi:selenocysteine lyase/cysteine desulfurase